MSVLLLYKPSIMFRNYTVKLIVMLAALSLIDNNLSAQSNIIRPYNAIYSVNINGGSTMIGNTILNAMNSSNAVDFTKMNALTNTNDGTGNYGNDGENMQFVDIDQNTATKNSSSAALVLPAGTNTIKFARLYWGGRFDTTGITNVADTLRKVKLRFANGSYTNLSAVISNVDLSPILFNGVNTSQKNYQSYTDITTFVNTNKAGTYTVADIPVSTGSIANGGYFGGWAIVVAYENLSEPFNSIRIFDGFSKVAAGTGTNSLSINLTGLNVPSTTLASGDAVMGAMVWEGDASLGSSATNPAGDFIKINNVAVSNSLNTVANFWNGSITKNNTRVTNKNPNYNNQMGIDIDEVNVGTGYNIQPNATSVNVQFGTEADTYFPSLFTFIVRAKQGSLPVKLISFTANKTTDNDALLNWTTASEVGTDFFEIEKSEDGINFTFIGKVKSLGAASVGRSYNFKEKINNSATVVYYRLKIVDNDGQFNYSTIAAIKFGRNIIDFKVYPNPFVSDIYILLSGEKKSNSTIRIMTLDGKELFRKTEIISPGENIVSISEVNNIPKGNYLLEIITENKRQIQKILKN
jgi:hypothetical protein